ncbi:MAG TPA: CBS domain-containing protein [Anaeromyxobacteraceae bacterium]|nr:CBS domain-containing protein [Anaeromyxobacteraceae bacterium]
MLVRDAMTPRAETIGPEETLQAAAMKMRALNLGALPVKDDDHLVGMVTDRDLAIRGVAAGRDPARTPVREAMTPQVVWCFEDQDTLEAARIMEDKAIRRVMVLDRRERLVGLLSVDDLAASARQERLAGEVLDSAVALRPPAG